jgi:UDP-N-acetylmuramoyl-L-alanyl-D-glutamate--2,6-diaminopimelate ligase
VKLGAIADRLAGLGILREVVAAGEWRSLAVDDVTVDSRLGGPGTLFCAIAGTHQDGHVYLAEVADRGAVAAVVERAEPGLRIPQLRVERARAAAFAAAEFYGDPWDELTLVGVTGTNGKTTTAAILRHLLSRRGRASIGTLGVVGADGEVDPGHRGADHPGPVELAGGCGASSTSDVRARWRWRSPRTRWTRGGWRRSASTRRSSPTSPATTWTTTARWRRTAPPSCGCWSC